MPLDNDFTDSLLRAVRPLASRASESLVDAIEHAVKERYPSGGFSVGYIGDGVWRVRELDGTTLHTASLLSALRTVYDLRRPRKGVKP